MIGAWKEKEQDDSIGINECVVKFIEPEYLRRKEQYFIITKATEMKGLQDQGVWVVIKNTQLPRKTNILGVHFIVCPKNHEMPHEKPKVRYVP